MFVYVNIFNYSLSFANLPIVALVKVVCFIYWSDLICVLAEYIILFFFFIGMPIIKLIVLIQLPHFC